MQNLPLKVAAFYSVVVHNADCADAGRGKVERYRGTKPSGTDNENTGGKKLFLS